MLHAWASDDAAAADVIRESLAVQRQVGSEIARPHQLGLLADVLDRHGRGVEAAAAIDDALAQAAATGDRDYEPALLRLKARLTQSYT